MTTARDFAKHAKAISAKIAADNADKTPVVYRRWNGKGGDVFALFPTIPSDTSGIFCQSYQHIGQHGGADFHGCIKQSRPTRGDEHAELHAELQRIGYKLKPIVRVPQSMHRERRKGGR